MALYKYTNSLARRDHPDFDKRLKPDAPTPHTGIYRCCLCGDEAVAMKGTPLPARDHHVHTDGQPIEWQLLVSILRA